MIINRTILLMAVLAFCGFVAQSCNEVGYYGDEKNCGNEQLDGAEICDGIYFLPGYSDCRAFDDTKNWVSGTPRCSETCELTVGTCKLAGE